PKDGVIIYRYQKKNPDEDPATAPQTAQEFLDAMSKATGLTGVALILYLVVSGSSRVIFPPRNVIPVP
ncbi:MAG: hypothetical protein MUC48_27265, partial [Leptolyngbya sp. Prado105]|nr:hypothetical protein [Leptolyngbya sp. Prado105]